MEIAIAVSASGDNTIVPAQGANKKIIMKELFLAGRGAVGGHIKSGASGSAHFASAASRFPFTSGGGFLLKGTDRRWTGDTNQPMVLNLDDTIAVVGYARFDVESDVQGQG